MIDLSYENFCNESLLKEFESILEYDQKDIKRIQDFFTKAGGDFDKVIRLANTMANSITNAEKAFNRAEAAKVVMSTKAGENNPVADIFYARAKDLGYDETKIPVSTPKQAPIKQDVTSQKPPKEVKPKEQPVEVKPPKEEKVEITHVPDDKPASQKPESERFHSSKAPRTRPGKSCAGVPILPIGKVNIAKGTCSLYEDPQNSIYENWNGTAEIWKLNNGQHVIIFTAGTDPTVEMETETAFIHDQSGDYLFFGELVDYIRIADMSAFIDLYGNTIQGYTYK